jgi:hypothetical protein
MARVHRGAVNAAVGAGRCGGGEFSFGAGQAGGGVVEDVLVGAGPRFEDVRVAGQQAEIGGFGAGVIDQALAE